MTYDEGFGTGSFGEGLFGKQDVARYLLWELGVANRIKRDDEKVGYHLRDTLLSIEPAFEELVDKLKGLPNQVDPLQAVDSENNNIELEIVASEIRDGVQRLYFNPIDETFKKINQISPHTQDVNGEWLNDGWDAFINAGRYPVVGKNSKDYWIDVDYTDTELSGTLTFVPFSLLDLLSDKFHIHTHRADPVDWKRRALYRQNLLRQWKVSDTYYELLGKFYGFEVRVAPLYCVHGDLCEQFKETYPDRTHETDNKCFTEKKLGVVKFDRVDADVIPVDTNEDFFIATNILNAVEADPNEYPDSVVLEQGSDFWVVEIDKDTWDLINDPTNLYLEDADGVEHKVESNEPAIDDSNLSDSVENELTVLADHVETGAGQLRYEVEDFYSDDYKRASAYWVYIQQKDVLNRDLDQSDMLESIIQKIDRDIPEHIRVIAYNVQWTSMTNALQSGLVDSNVVIT